MNKSELISRLDEWKENGDDERIVEAILVLPENMIDDDILLRLAEGYIGIEEYKKAIAVLEGQHARMENDYNWQFCMGRALYYASMDEECENDEALRDNILERAKVSIARTMAMNPPEEILEESDKFSELIEMAMDGKYPDEDNVDDEYMEYMSENGDEEFSEDTELYDDDELDAVEEHLEKNFGEFPTVLHEINSPDIHCDVYVISPTEEYNFYTLCTVGMGAHIMSLPEELDPAEYGRAELFITLPPDWKVGENSDEWFWPIGLLKGLARLPIRCDTWLGWGHTIDNQNYFAENTELCGSILINPVIHGQEACECVLPNGDKVNFYQVIPLYREEMEYKIDHRAEELLKLFQEQHINPVVDISRPNVCNDYRISKPAPIDCVSDHSPKITEKNLPLNEINGCNHIAIFMRWCIEHDLVAPQFHENCGDVVKRVLEGSDTDIRQFIIDYFDGKLEIFQLSFVGASFCRFYYNWDAKNPDFFYPRDVDSYAESYFGTEKYNSDEFQDEAYLFVPFDENYYRGMCRYIDRAFEAFYPGFVDYQNDRSRPAVEAAENLLGCGCVFPAAPEHIGEIFAAESGKGDTFPLLLIIDEDGGITDTDSLCEVLEDSLIPYLTTMTIAQLPCGSRSEAAEYFQKRFVNGKTSELSSMPLNMISKKISEKYGCGYPAVVSFGENSIELYLQGGEEKYIRVEIPTEKAE